MEENISIYEQCRSAFRTILDKCENGKYSEPIGKSEDGNYIFYKLENGLYLWHLLERNKHYSNDIGKIYLENNFLDIITKCDPTNIENVQDVYPAIFKSTDDEYFYGHGNCLGITETSVRLTIFQNDDFSSYAEIRSEKRYNKITEKSCLPVQPNTKEDLSECFSPDVQQLLLQAKEKTSDEALINAYDKAIQLYDMFIEFSKDIEQKENPNEQNLDMQGWLQLQYDKSIKNSKWWLNTINDENPVKPENINVIQDLSMIYKILEKEKRLSYQIEEDHIEIMKEKRNKERKIAEEKQKEKQEIYEKQRRRNYLGLKGKAEKLGKGEMSLEDYIKCSKTSIDDLIIFAKKENMDADVIKGLYKYVKPYKSYKKPFAKVDYLKSTILIINGQEVKPTEEDVDKCVEYLQVNGSLICEKTVKDTVRGYLKGEIDITIKETDLEEQIEENKEIISENEQKINDELVGVLIEQQDEIKSQQTEIINVKKKEVGTYGE